MTPAQNPTIPSANPYNDIRLRDMGESADGTPFTYNGVDYTYGYAFDENNRLIARPYPTPQWNALRSLSSLAWNMTYGTAGPTNIADATLDFMHVSKAEYNTAKDARSAFNAHAAVAALPVLTETQVTHAAAVDHTLAVTPAGFGMASFGGISGLLLLLAAGGMLLGKKRR